MIRRTLFPYSFLAKTFTMIQKLDCTLIPSCQTCTTISKTKFVSMVITIALQPSTWSIKLLIHLRYHKWWWGWLSQNAHNWQNIPSSKSKLSWYVQIPTKCTISYYIPSHHHRTSKSAFALTAEAVQGSLIWLFAGQDWLVGTLFNEFIMILFA